MEEPLLIDEKQAAKLLGDISETHLANLRKAGQIPYVPMGRRVLYDPQALRRWIVEQSKQGEAC